MKGQNKCLRSAVSFRPFLFALLAIFSLLLSSLSPLVANAAAGFDDDLQTVDSLKIDRQNFYGSGVCPVLDVTLSWSEYLLNPNAPYEAGGYTETLPSLQASYRAALANAGSGGSWGVSSLISTSGDGYDKSVYIFWNENSPVSVTFSGNGSVYAQADHVVRLAYDRGCKNVAINYSGKSVRVSSDESTDQSGPKLFFVSYGDVAYPEGYKGALVPENGGGKITIKPDFTYSVNGKDIQAKDYNLDLPTFQPDPGYTIQGYSVAWSVFKCSSYKEVGHICNDSDLVKFQILPQNQTFNYSVSSYSDYMLEASYQVEQCYRYPSYPATPDHCFYVDLGTKIPDYDFTRTRVHLKVDGSAFSGDTKDADCDVSGFCVPPSPYEDCSTYGVDIIGGLGCQFRNFGVWLTNTLKMLFIPSGQFFVELFKDFGDFFNKKLGFIAYPITFLIDFFTKIMNAAGNSSCKIEGGTLFGVNADLDLCIMQNSIPVIFNGIILFIRSAVAFALLFALYHKYQEFVSEGGTKS